MACFWAAVEAFLFLCIVAWGAFIRLWGGLRLPRGIKLKMIYVGYLL